MKFGQILRARRKELGLTQQDIADLWGIKNVNVSDWEAGKTMPEAAKLPALAKRLKMSISALMGEGDVDLAITGKSKDGGKTVVLVEMKTPQATTTASLQWVCPDEAYILSLYRRMAPEEQDLYRISGESLPKLESSSIVGHKH